MMEKGIHQCLALIFVSGVLLLIGVVCHQKPSVTHIDLQQKISSYTNEELVSLMREEMKNVLDVFQLKKIGNDWENMKKVRLQKMIFLEKLESIIPTLQESADHLNADQLQGAILDIAEQSKDPEILKRWEEKGKAVSSKALEKEKI